ncbi:hypothetical protein [Methylosinus sp. H3A]|uniref:hypothetical protein n=1 Tax=Methylosinus sp. H3A TaxID=2785786 RepID=UPI001AED4DA0|nr:hypothetical protein [Methylosinus sp. H3A]
MAANSNRRDEPVETVMLLEEILWRERSHGRPTINGEGGISICGSKATTKFYSRTEDGHHRRHSSPNLYGRTPSPNSPRSPSGQALHNGLFDGRIWPKAGCASIAYAAMAPIDFLPLTAAPSFLAKQQSRSRAILR